MPRDVVQHIVRRAAAILALLGVGNVACVDEPTPAARRSNVVLPNLSGPKRPPARRLSAVRRRASTLLLSQQRGTVGAAWVEQRLGNPTLRILDLRPAREFRRGHLPGATSDPEGRALLAMVLAHRRLAAPKKPLVVPGLSTGQTVVLVHGGSDLADRAVAARAYLLLYAAGVSPQALAILRGGHGAWRQQRRPRTTAQALGQLPRPTSGGRPAPKPSVTATARPAAPLGARNLGQRQVLLTEPTALIAARKRPHTEVVHTGLTAPPVRANRPKSAWLRFGLAPLELTPGARTRTTAELRILLGKLLTARDKVRLIAFSERGLWASLLWFTLKTRLRRADTLNAVVLGPAGRALAVR